MQIKAYRHTYHNYTFYADSPEDLLGQLAQLLIVGMDRNYLLKKYKEEQDKEKKKDYKVMLDASIRHFKELKAKLEDPYR